MFGIRRRLKALLRGQPPRPAIELDTPVEIRQTLPVRLKKTLTFTGDQVRIRT